MNMWTGAMLPSCAESMSVPDPLEARDTLLGTEPAGRLGLVILIPWSQRVTLSFSLA